MTFCILWSPGLELSLSLLDLFGAFFPPFCSALSYLAAQDFSPSRPAHSSFLTPHTWPVLWAVGLAPPTVLYYFFFSSECMASMWCFHLPPEPNARPDLRHTTAPTLLPFTAWFSSSMLSQSGMMCRFVVTAEMMLKTQQISPEKAFDGGLYSRIGGACNQCGRWIRLVHLKESISKLKQLMFCSSCKSGRTCF